MKKQSSKKMCSTFSSLLQCYIILAGCIIFSSCIRHPQQPSQNSGAKKPVAINNIKKGAFAPPKVISITSANLPKVIKAGTPTIRIDSSNGGAPFFTNYGTEQGLALSGVSCSFEDRSGYIWFGTQGGGVSRYDGKSFTNYTTAQGLAGNSVQSIIQDKAGNIWFGTRGGGASKYDGKSFINYSKKQGLADNNVWSIIQDKAGNIWFGTDGGGLSRYDGKIFTNYTKAQGLAGNIIWSIMQDKAGNIWFGTNGGGVSRYDGKSVTNYTTAQGLAGNSVNSIIQDKDGNIWFGTDGGGASRYDGKSFTNYTKAQGLAGNSVNRIIQDKDGNIWFGTDGGGLSRYDGKIFTNYTKAQGLAGNSVLTIMQDEAGNIWFGIAGSGISRYDGKAFTNYTIAQGLAGNQVLSIMQDGSGNTWFGTVGNGVSRYDGKTFTNYTALQGLAGNTVRSIMQDKTGNIWFGTQEDGASKYDGKTFTNYSTAQGLASNHVLSMMQDKAGNIWFGTAGGGASRYDGRSFTNYTTAQGLADNFVWAIKQDKKGDIWFGTASGGVSRYDGKSFTNYTTAQGLAGNFVWSIMQDRSGGIWFGTDGHGASRYDGKSFTNYTTSQGLADNEVYAIAEDPKTGIVWFGTNLGLSGLPVPLSENGNIQINKFENFNKNTGYPVKDLNTNALIVDNNEILWGGCGDDKIIRFDYSMVNKDPKPLQLQIEGIRVNGENICWNNLTQHTKKGTTADSLALLNEMVTTFGKVLPAPVLDTMRKKYSDIRFDSIARFNPAPLNLALPYEDRNLTIDFAAIAPDKPKQVKYQYKLEGYDKDWSPPGNGTTAVFGNIPEGSYTFKLKALSVYGVWSSAEYKFTVLSPWYRTLWSYLLYLGLFAGIIWGFIYYRSLSLLKDKRKLEYMVQIRTEEVMQQNDEIIQHKEEIESQRDNLEVQKNNLEKTLIELKSTQNQLIQSEKMASLGELTAGIAHEIQNPLNFVNNFSEVNAELIGEMKQEIDKGNLEEIKAIAKDIEENSKKINLHGKRADAIVKGMLQHSQSGTGTKESTNISALADECMLLAYHGLRAKDKSFNAELVTHFDETMPRINVIPQDMARVMLNLFNNAFYAVNQKAKTAGAVYKPEVSVTSAVENSQVIIKVKDNGTGIPDSIKEKIMQPFFTTKPTGEGTGLGLSLTYDMVVKGHGGKIEVNTNEGEFTEFVVSLPLNQ